MCIIYMSITIIYVLYIMSITIYNSLYFGNQNPFLDHPSNLELKDSADHFYSNQYFYILTKLEPMIWLVRS